MFVKSVKILIGASLLALAAVIAYAAFLSRPDEDLERAAAMVARGEAAAAVADLGVLERAPSVQTNPKLREQLLRLRQRAYSDLGNHVGALRDVEALLAAGTPDRDALALEGIRLRAMAGDGQGALIAAERFLEQQPRHGRALELAGEACQKMYQPLLAGLNERLVRDLPLPVRAGAQAAMWSFVYRPAGDPEIETARGELAALYGADARLLAAWRDLVGELTTLRERVQQGLGWFQQSLAASAAPVAAFRVVALAHDQSGRIDDLLVACEIQRRRARHAWVDEAGAAAAWALLRDGAYPAAIATAERWMPAGTVARHVAAGTWPAGTLDLLLARVQAAWATGEKSQISRLWPDMSLLFRIKGQQVVAAQLTAAYQQWYDQDFVRAESSVRLAFDTLAKLPLVPGRIDVLPELAAMAIDLLQRRSADEGEVQAALQAWQRARAGTLEPLAAKADVLLARGRAAAALAEVDKAQTLAPDDERLFDLRLAALRALGAQSGQDGATLLAQCRQRQVEVPDVRDPIGYLLCAEAALEQRQWPIAASCARAAVDALPRARAPRLLEIRVSTAAGRLADARRQCDRLLELLPPDPATLELALATWRSSGTAPASLLCSAMTWCAPNAALQGELLRAALQRKDGTAADFVTAASREPRGPAELRLLVAAALAGAGRPDDAATLLGGVLDEGGLPPACHADLARAFAAWLVAAAERTPDAGLVPTVERFVARMHETLAAGAPVLLPVVDRLASDHPATALAVAGPVLAQADPEARTGGQWGQLGALALRQGDLRAGEEWLLAAVAFADGRRHAQDLVRVCLATDRPDRAARLVTLIDTPDDAALAAAVGNLPIAVELAARALAADPADLLTQATLATFGQPSLLDWQGVEGDARTERLVVLTLLRSDTLAALAEGRLRAMAAREPASTTVKLLLARALAARGDGGGAAAIHRELFAARAASAVFWREVAVAADASGYELGAPMRLALVDAIAAGGVGGSARTLAFARREVERAYRAAGHLAAADALRTERLADPGNREPVSSDDLDFAAATLPPATALAVIERARGGARPPQPAVAVAATVRVAERLVGLAPPERDDARTAVQRCLARDGARGPLVHFLLAHADANDADAATTRRTLLDRHLAAVAAGDDDASWLDRTLALLVADRGAGPVATTLADLLQRHPTALPLWAARARLLFGTSAARPAVTALRAAVRHSDRADLALAAVLAAAEARALVPADHATFAALPAELRDTPAGRYTRGLLALRSGQPAEALTWLDATFERDNGMHLFARALALLQSPDPAAEPAAGALFDRLARDYASSALARNAGRFADQLAPR